MAKKNPRLKRANSLTDFTSEQILELKKCAEDPIYFIRKYVKIQHPTRGAINFDLYQYQEKMVKAFHHERFNIVLSSRQTGKSVVAGAFLLWYAIFHFDKTVLIASNKNSNAMEMIHRIRYAYEELPAWLKPGISAENWNKHELAFDNNSRIVSTATSPDSGRGMSVSLLYADELAFVPDNVQQEFWTSILPTLSTGGSCIVTSTPNGDSNLFATLWRQADVGVQSDNILFKPIRVFWNEPPDRDEKFKQQIISTLGVLKWQQEYECVRGDTLVEIQDDHGNIKILKISELYQKLMTNSDLV